MVWNLPSMANSLPSQFWNSSILEPKSKEVKIEGPSRTEEILSSLVDAVELAEKESSPPPEYALTKPQTVSDISVETAAENNEEENMISSNEERAVADGFVADDGAALQIGGGDFDLFSSEDATLAKATGLGTTVELEANQMRVAAGIPRPTGNNLTLPNKDIARAVGFIATEGATLRATRNNVDIRSYGKATFARASGPGTKMVITGTRAEIHAGLPRG